MVYEGMRSASGPLLLSLGASALVVGLVTGAGEAVALGLRLVSGPLADRTGRHWQLTVQGIATVLLLGLLRRGADLDAQMPVDEDAGSGVHPSEATALPRSFWAFSVSCACSTLGLMTFGVMSVHLVRAHLVTDTWVP